MNPTHKRIIRTAKCTQWLGSNLPEVLPYFPNTDLEIYREKYLMIRSPNTNLVVLEPTDWVVLGEDLKVRVYPESKFNLMYEKL